MTQEAIVEAMAESAHNCWWAAYKQLGYTSRLAAWGEEFMVPYEELSEQGKEFDRVIMRAILAAFETNDLKVVEA
jgi:hydroxylamine reductase (hybrid-cluster protein)